MDEQPYPILAVDILDVVTEDSPNFISTEFITMLKRIRWLMEGTPSIMTYVNKFNGWKAIDASIGDRHNFAVVCSRYETLIEEDHPVDIKIKIKNGWIMISLRNNDKNIICTMKYNSSFCKDMIHEVLMVPGVVRDNPGLLTEELMDLFFDYSNINDLIDN